MSDPMRMSDDHVGMVIAEQTVGMNCCAACKAKPRTGDAAGDRRQALHRSGVDANPFLLGVVESISCGARSDAALSSSKPRACPKRRDARRGSR